MAKNSPLLIFFLFISVILIPSMNYQSITNANPFQMQFQLSSKSTTSTLSVLVVLMELQDDPHYPLHTIDHYVDLFFSDNALSVNQYYENVSYGTVSLEGDILGWYQAKNNLEYYGFGTRLSSGQQDSRPDELAYEAFNNSLKDGKNPLNYDLFVVIHSGDGQEYSGNSDDIWSHMWSLWRYGYSNVEYSMNHEYVDYSTPSHELGHTLYFPDLYDHLYYEHIFAGPYCMMGRGDSQFSIWNKYYSHVSRYDSPQFLSDIHRLKINNYSSDEIITINPISIKEPVGIMWLELGWNSSGFPYSYYGRGWTVTVRENLDYDAFLPKHGVVIAEVQVGPRSYSQIQVSSDVYPPWNVIDSHPETEENKDDAAFSLIDGDIGTYSSGKGWAIQLLEKHQNLSYSLRITNETNIPNVMINPPENTVSGTYNLLISANTNNNNDITIAQISINNGPWQNCSSDTTEEGLYIFNWDTTQEKEGNHLIRARAIDNNTIPYIGYSSHINIEVDNKNGTILVIDDDIGRISEIPVINALDSLNLLDTCEIKQTSSFTNAEISADELMKYKYIIWIGNPSISPLSNSHINYEEFKQIKQYLMSHSDTNPPRILFMCSYNIFDFSNQGVGIQNEASVIFRASSPKNFRAPVNLLSGFDFLNGLPSFTLGKNDTLFDTRRSDGEVVNLLPGAIPILEDLNPEFLGFSTKGYYVDDGNYKLINYLFQPEMVPEDILPQIINLSLNYLDLPNNSTFPQSTTSNHTASTTPLEIDPLFLLFGTLSIIGLGSFIIIRKVKSKSSLNESYWLKRKEFD